MKKSEDGYYRVTFTFNGKRYERKGKTQAEAHEKAAELKAALKRGDIGVSSSMSVSAWAREWLEVYKRPGIGEGQYQNYKSHINNVIVPAIGNLKVKDVKDIHLQKVLNSRSGKSKADLLKLRMTIVAIFRRAVASKLIPANPAEFLEVPAAKAGTHRSITAHERDKILLLAETHRAGLLIKTLLYTGIRPNEARALEWRHIDFEKRIIHITQAVKARTNEIGAPKSAAGVRDVPLQDKLYPALLSKKGGPFEPIFTATDGTRLSESGIRSLWKSFKRELDLMMGAASQNGQTIICAAASDLTPYCLRHTFCTDLQDAGVPINIARYLMGHTDISVTARIYTHTTEKAIQSAAEKLNAVALDVAQAE